jgi:hypothetical protein
MTLSQTECLIPFDKSFSHTQNAIVRKEKDSSSRPESDGDVYLRPSPRFPTPYLEREQCAPIKHRVTRRSQDRYLPRRSADWINPQSKNSDALIPFPSIPWQRGRHAGMGKIAHPGGVSSRLFGFMANALRINPHINSLVCLCDERTRRQAGNQGGRQAYSHPTNLSASPVTTNRSSMIWATAVIAR